MHDAELGSDLAELLRVQADRLGVDAAAGLLAAHAVVLHKLSGEQDVSTGLLRDAARSCRMSVGDGSWRDLLAVADRALAATAAAEPELARQETMLDPEGTATSLPEGTAMLVSRIGDTLRIRYRADIADPAYAERIAGYYRAALGAQTADPDAAHQSVNLLSDLETELQLDGFAARSRELPDARFHRLFERRAHEHPDTVAAICAGVTLTYGELNARANRIARALLHRGLRAEDVVAVVTERNLDWMACVLAVFKAGGAYLPIEPHFPAERVAATLGRSGCRFALTEPGSADSLNGLDIRSLCAGELAAEDWSAADVDVDVGPDQLAYVYFTSGSTGEPKGAMCEHTGMLNHLYAKIDDLGIEAGTVVAQTAPQCFDISLWQLVSALLVGGHTLIIEQAAIMDVDRFVTEVITGGVDVMQLVPSYLDVVLARFEGSSGDLGRVRVVSTTGEALKVELVRRWFARFPDIKVVNAYGLTETSDDTNHEVLDRAPDTGRIALGRPVSNVWVAVIDEQMALLPLGAPGEIVFSGVCVGRGYINDPQRTERSFVPDPFHPGARLYHSGDFGRWGADGKLEFLGRRDAQVKIRGFRVEIGEVENHLLRMSGVRDAAVVVSGQSLVGFVRADEEVSSDTAREFLAHALPEYMVPERVHRLDELPLTGNGKIDTKTLIALAAERGVVEPPQTPTERRLAAAWAEVLASTDDQIGRTDQFFERGGTSLAAVRLMIKLEREVTLQDLTAHPVLADLAAFIDRQKGMDDAALRGSEAGTANAAGRPADRVDH